MLKAKFKESEREVKLLKDQLKQSVNDNEALINDLSTLDKIAEETKRDEKHMEKASL